MHWAQKKASGTGRPSSRERTSSDDVAAFLLGSYLEFLQEAKSPVPRWAWLNELAHGDVASLQDLAGQLWVWTLAGREEPEASWVGARLVLAQELLELTGGEPERLVEFQRDALVPLELELMAREASSSVGVAEFIELTRTALHKAMC